MGKSSIWLVAGGLVWLTGPLSFTACAQDYVDVEAERSGRTTPATPEPAAEPYARPAQPQVEEPASRPTTSYGLDSAPAGPVITAPAPASAAPVGPQNQPVTATSGTGELFLAVQQLRQEVMRLNGIVEEQANELRQLKSQSLERYVDLDRRVSALSGGPVSGGGATLPGAGSAGTVALGNAAELPGESDAYRSAYALVSAQSFDQAVEAFKAFLQRYPDGRYAPNAHYWLGELYLVTEPPDPELSRQSFSLLLDQYPDNPKAPDAMYKLGTVYFMKGNRARSREYLDRVIREYGDSGSSAVPLARKFIEENF